MAVALTRDELNAGMDEAWHKLAETLDSAPEGVGDLVVVDTWTTRDLLAVRLWWNRAVISWIAAGKAGEALKIPAPGYKWNQTPALNASIVAEAQSVPYSRVRRELEEAVEQMRNTIAGLSDAELEEKGAFAWTGTMPLVRWIGINTIRQYTSARGYIRKAIKSQL